MPMRLPMPCRATRTRRESGELLYRAYCHMDVDYLDRYIAAGLHTGFGDSMVRIGGIKQYSDGSISERTAWLAEPYIGLPNYFGVQSGTRESLYEHSRKAWLAGFQLATHANGEHAIDPHARGSTNSWRKRRRAATRAFGWSIAPW